MGKEGSVVGIDVSEAATVMASENVALQRERNSVFKEQAAPCTFHTQNAFLPAPTSIFLVCRLAYFESSLEYSQIHFFLSL